jgi:hypothetical protein
MLGAIILLRLDGLATVLPPDYTGRPASGLVASIPGRWAPPPCTAAARYGWRTSPA